MPAPFLLHLYVHLRFVAFPNKSFYPYSSTLLEHHNTPRPPLHHFNLSSLWAATLNQNWLFKWALTQGTISACDFTEQLQDTSTTSLIAINRQITSLTEALIQILHTLDLLNRPGEICTFFCVFLYWETVLLLWTCLVGKKEICVFLYTFFLRNNAIIIMYQEL